MLLQQAAAAVSHLTYFLSFKQQKQHTTTIKKPPNFDLQMVSYLTYSQNPKETKNLNLIVDEFDREMSEKILQAKTK